MRRSWSAATKAFRWSTARTLLCIWPKFSQSPLSATKAPEASCSNRESRDNRAQTVCQSWAGFGQWHIGRRARSETNPGSNTRRSKSVRLRQLRSELQSRWQFLATNTLRFPIFLPTGTSEITSHHTFHGHWFCFTHNHRATRELIAKQL